MPRATKAESERTAQRIRETAMQHFREHGYDNADLVTIAAAAGVTRGAIYHHYPSKHALFVAVAAELHAQVQQHIEAAASLHDDLWEQLIAGSEAFLQTATDPAISRILLIDAPSVMGWDRWRALDESTSFSSLTDVMQALESAGQIPPGSAEPSARLLSGAMNEAVLWLASEPDPETARAQVMASLTAMIRSLSR